MKIKSTMDSIKDKTLSEIITEINQYLKILPNYKAGFFSNEAFSIFIHSDLKTYFTEFDSLFFCGYFTNAFAEILKKISEQYTRDMGNTRPYVALLSHGFRKDTRGKQNYKALKKIKKYSMDVKVCDNLHARIILGYNKQKHDTFVIIGSFDFTKEAISGELYNIGICSKDPELFKNTFKFFTNLWESEETKELDEYWESK